MHILKKTVEALRSLSTPTVSNAIELFNLRPRNEGYLSPDVRCLFPELGVMVGHAVTLRFAAPDVIHGILITGTNVNTMVVPGFAAQVHTQFTRSGDLLMPCHEYCSLGHSEMWATVQVLPESAFQPDRDGRVSCAQR